MTDGKERTEILALVARIRRRWRLRVALQGGAQALALTLAVVFLSSLERMDPMELVAQITPPPAQPGSGTALDAVSLRREDRERRQSFWRYLLAGAFALLLLETALSNWLSRRGGTPGVAAG